MDGNMNGSTGTIRIFLNDDTVYEAPCSEQECLTAMETLGPVVYETTIHDFFLGSRRVTDSRAPYGMSVLEFNNKNNIIHLYHSEIKRIYWESNI